MPWRQLTLFIATIFVLITTETIGPAILGVSSVRTMRFFFLGLYFIMTGLHLRKSSGNELMLVMLGFIAMLIWSITGGRNNIEANIFMFIIPALFSLIYKEIRLNFAIKLRYLIYVFFIFECLFAIYEKSINHAFFPLTEDVDLWQNNMTLIIDESAYGFRSTSLFGNPLTNALIVMTIYPFLLFDLKNKWQRLFLSVLTLMALSCFNARGATIIFFVVFAINYFYNEIDRRKQSFFYDVIGFAVLFLFILVIYSKSSYGGRLFNQNEVFDASAQTRIEVLPMVLNTDILSFLFGDPYNPLAYTENGLLDFIFLYGFLFTVVYLIVYSRILNKYLSNYTIPERIVIAFSSFGVSMTNPNFNSYGFILYLLISTHVFSKIKGFEIRKIRQKNKDLSQKNRVYLKQGNEKSNATTEFEF